MAGFEPANNNFAGCPLKPLEYIAIKTSLSVYCTATLYDATLLPAR